MKKCLFCYNVNISFTVHTCHVYINMYNFNHLLFWFVFQSSLLVPVIPARMEGSVLFRLVYLDMFVSARVDGLEKTVI